MNTEDDSRRVCCLQLVKNLPPEEEDEEDKGELKERGRMTIWAFPSPRGGKPLEIAADLPRCKLLGTRVLSSFAVSSF